MSPIIRSCVSIAFVLSVVFSYGNHHPGDGDGALTPDCSLTVDTTRINCNFMRLSWGNSETSRTVDVKVVNSSGYAAYYNHFYGNEFLLTLLPQALTVYIRPSLSDGGEPCAWQEVGVFTKSGDCTGCMTLGFTMFVNHISCSHFVLSTDYPVTITDLKDDIGGNSIPFQTGIAGNQTYFTTTSDLGNNRIYYLEVTVTYPDGSTCSVDYPFSTGDCDGEVYDLALTVESDGSAFIANDENSFLVKIHNQTNEFTEDVEVNIALPAGFTGSSNNTLWSLVGGRYVLSDTLNVLPYEVIEIPFLFDAPNDTNSYVIEGEIIAMDPLSVPPKIDKDSDPDTDLTNDTYLGDNIIDQDGKNGGDEDDHDQLIVDLVEAITYDLALRVTSPTDTIGILDVVSYEISVHNQGTEIVDEFTILAAYNDTLQNFLSGNSGWTTQGMNQLEYTHHGTLNPGDTIGIPLSLETTLWEDEFKTMTLLVEISAASVPGYANAEDADSEPDQDLYNDLPLIDNEINNAGGDEDDHDIENIVLHTELIEPYDLNCGDSVDVIANTVSLPKVFDGLVFVVNGIPVFDTEFSNHTGGTYSGTGLIPLPFFEGDIAVEFSGIQINKFFHAFNGVVDVQSTTWSIDSVLQDFTGNLLECSEIPQDDLGNNPNPATGLDELGFDSLGFYRLYDPSMPFDSLYDPRGFRADSTYLDTGSPYDPDGCNILGLDSLGQPCPGDGSSNPPYYWLDDDPTDEGRDFYNDHKDNLDSLIQDALDTILTSVLDSFVNFTCYDFQQKVAQSIINLNADSKYILKHDNSYLLDGMSEKFDSEPLMLNIQNRDPDVDSLETNHVALYHCDKIRRGIEGRKNTIQEFYNEDHSSDLHQYIRAKMIKMTQEEIDEVQQRLQEWIIEQVYEYIFNHEDGHSYKDMDFTPFLTPPSDFVPYKNRFRSKESEINNAYTTTVSNSNVLMDDIVSTAQMEYEQGFEYVQGVPHAYFVEEHARKARKEFKRQMAISGDTVMKAPLTLWNATSGQDNNVYFHDISLDAQSGNNEVSLSVVLNNPKADQGIAFQTTGIKFGTGGFTDEVKLSLANDTLPIRLTNVSQLILEGDSDPNLSGTYVKVDCNGFAGLGIDGFIRFCSEKFAPVDASTGEVLANEPLEAHFQVEMPSFPEFYAAITIPEFVMKNNPEFRIQVTNAIIDYSTVVSVDPDTINLPEFYMEEMETQITEPSWIGFYLEDLTVQFENPFKGGETSTAYINNFIIDDQGLSGLLGVTNFVDIANGDAGGWQTSVDTLEIGFVSNRFSRSKINGQIVIPLTDQNGAMDFRGEIYPQWNFDLKVILRNNINVDLWKANMNLRSGSYVQIGNTDDGIKCLAHLNGAININASDQPGKLQMDDITFEGLELSNGPEKYFSPGKWSFPKGVSKKFGGFELSIDNIKIGKGASEEEPILKFDVALEVNKKVDLYGKVGLEFQGHLASTNPQRWALQKFKINKIAVQGSFPGVDHLAGTLIFYDENGEEGFYGALDVHINKLKTSISAAAEFGRVNDEERYFFIDFMAIIGGTGIPIAPGFNIYGLGGGVSYNMTQSEFDVTSGSYSNEVQDTDAMTRGDTPSGLSYQVDLTKGLGFNAKAFLGLTSKEVFNACVTFSMEFNDKDNGGGISNIGFNGYFAMLMKPGDNLQCVNATAPINGAIFINYNFNQRILDAKFAANIDVGGAVLGGGSGEMVFSPSGWYIKIGQHEDFKDPGLGPIVLNVLNFAKFHAYFQAGTKVDPMPPLPEEVSNMTGLGNIGRNESAFATGRGIAFGAHVQASIGKKSGKFYAYLEAMAGADINLQKYKGLICAQSGESIGVNGWYAMGQAYIYLDGRIGFKPRKKKYDILRAAVAAAIQLKTPNPTYGRGALAVKYKVLFWKGTFKMNFSIGEECEYEYDYSNGVLQQDIVQVITPFSETRNVTTDAVPEVRFNYKFGKVVEMRHDSTSQEFEVKLKSLTFEQLGSLDTFSLSYKEDWQGKTVRLVPNYYLYPHSKFRIMVVTELYKDGTLLETQMDTSVFETGDALKYIPQGNIVASYPMKGQYHYYTDSWVNSDSPSNFIKISKVQPGLFINSRIIFSLHNGASSPILIGDAELNFSEMKLIFDLDKEILVKGNAHKLNFYFVPIEELGNDPNRSAQDVYNYVNFESQLPAYSYFFRVSEYATFEDKINYIIQKGLTDIDPSSGVKAKIPVEACFDEYEIFGYNERSGEYSGELSIKLTTNYDENTWYKNTIYPLIYGIPEFAESLASRAKYWNDKLAELYEQYQRFSNLGLIINSVTVPPTNSSFFYAEDFPNEITGYDYEVFDGGQLFYSLFFTSVQEHWDALAFKAWYWSVFAPSGSHWSNSNSTTNKVEGPPPLPEPWSKWQTDGNYAEFPTPDDLTFDVSVHYRIPFTSGYSGPIPLDIINNISSCNYGGSSNDENGPNMSTPCYPTEEVRLNPENF